MPNNNPFASPNPDLSSTASSPSASLELPYKVEYEFDEDDYLATLAHIHGTSSISTDAIKKGRRRLIGMASVIGVLGAALWGVDGGPTGEMPFSAIMLWLVSASFVIAALRFRKILQKEASTTFKKLVEESRDTFVYGHKKYLFDEQGMNAEDKAGRGFRYWWAINRIDKQEDYLYVFTTKFEAAAIPSWAFINEDRFDSFCQLIERQWANNQNPAP